MDTNKVSNLFKYLKDKYEEESVRLPRFWEFTVTKMADHGLWFIILDIALLELGRLSTALYNVT